MAQPRNGKAVTEGRTEVDVMRTAGVDWAFGSAVALAPPEPDAYPEGWLFVAHRQADEWTVAFEGDVDFPKLTAAAPAEVVSAPEKEIFASHGPATSRKAPRLDAKPFAGGDFRTGMRLPYAIGQSWRLTGGPHGGVRQSIDLAGGDGRVLATLAGTFYVMCSSNRGWVRVAHDRGYSTDYYHLWNNRTAGGTVSAGTYLGDIGNDVSCGGSSSGPHVHFSLRQNGVYVGIAAHNFGKWQVYNGSAEYQGYALHGSAYAGIGGSLYNYGPLGFTQGIVDTNGGGVVNKRSGPGTGYAVVGTAADGTWVSDAFLWTGTGNPVNGRC